MSKRKRKRHIPKSMPRKPIAGFEVMVKFFIWEEEGLKELMKDVEEFIMDVDDCHTISDFDITPIYEEEVG